MRAVPFRENEAGSRLVGTIDASAQHGFPVRQECVAHFSEAGEVPLFSPGLADVRREAEEIRPPESGGLVFPGAVDADRRVARRRNSGGIPG